MIIENGTIRFIEYPSATEWLDENGDPVDNIKDISISVPCYIKAIELDNLAEKNGNSYTNASYEILIDDFNRSIEGRIAIEMNGRELGEFDIKEVQTLTVVGITKIIV